MTKLTASLTRTDHQKYASWYGDGTGRDTYVIVSNGGLTHVDKNYMTGPKGKRGLGYQPPKRDISPPSHKYISDGSGRDSYVISNHGGLVSDFRCTFTDALYKGSLRQYDRRP